MIHFSASLGSSAKIATAVVTLLFVGVIVVSFYTEPDILMVTFPILALVLGLSYYFSIKHYGISETELIIQRPFDSVSYRLDSIKSAQIIDKKDLRFAIRTFGIGGLFSYTGSFWNGKFGSMTWYVTRIDSAVLLTTSAGKIVLSPNERDKFISALHVD